MTLGGPVVPSKLIVGTWEVISRVDRTEDGLEVEEPSLGADPLALTNCDSRGRFAAQFVKRSRPAIEQATASAGITPNNSRAVNGYDAYFGTYIVDDEHGLVTRLRVRAECRHGLAVSVASPLVPW